MNADIGSFAILVGLVASVLGAVSVLVGIVRGRPDLMKLARPFSLVLLVAAVVAFVVMERALFTRDYELLYVAENGSPSTPPLYNFAALWAALEGSILLWGLVLAGYVVAVMAKFRDRLSDPLVGWAMITLFVVAAFFFFLMVEPANPFATWSPPPGFEGDGPNPLLQNHPLMAFHPPVLYVGYVGFTVPFAFAIAALVTARVGEGWLLEIRRWTLFAWAFLTVGIVLGAWWSYEVLGWGGYWAWDPVENASFLPWLTGTAFLHSVMVQERRGMLRVWNLSLVCATFSLTILGTFLTRSGVLDSVHSFSESDIGPLLLGFFAVIVLVTVGLIGWRGDELRSPGRIDSPLSREAAFLANNVLFAAFAFVVLLGTVFPLLKEAFDGGRISVGNPYFDRMTAPIGFTLLFLMAVAPALPWRKTNLETLSQRLLVPFWIGVATMLGAVLVGAHGWRPLLAFFLGGFAGGSALRQVVLATRRQGWRGLVGRTNGGMIVHIGVVLIAVAFAASNAYVRQGEFLMEPGDTATLAGHEIVFIGLEDVIEPDRTEVRALVQVDDDGVYAPGISTFPGGGQTIGTPSVRTSFTNDVSLSLIQVQDTGAVQIRVTVQPLIMWLWIGGGVMALGSVLAAFPGRRRRPTSPVSAPVPTADADPVPV
ncbi:MAG: heme lyase CcmF/NrfE family subunit [Acidimicrobiales bacterium]